jgi:hypothetical protein
MTTAILDVRPVSGASVDLVRLFNLDRLPERPPLACHWQRDADGRLRCRWAPVVQSP